MTALFYQLINNIEKISQENYSEFKLRLDNLFVDFKEHEDLDNLKVLRNKVSMLLEEYLKEKKEYKDIKKELKELQKFVHEVDEYIEEIEENQEKNQLIDVVKQVEKSYKSFDKIPEEKQHKYKQIGVKRKDIEYEKEIIKLQLELVKLQRHIIETGQKVLIIFEGRDAAGKGGNIKRFTEYLNPRAARVVALQKPTEVEKTQWYFQRYIKNLPNGGEMVFFDRSWYNRAGVEPVM